MSKAIKFVFEKNIFEILYDDNESIENIIEKYAKILSVKSKDLFFSYKGKNILEIKGILNKLKNNNNNNIISVIKLYKNKTTNDLENIICPKCKNLSFLKINEYDITIKNASQSINLSILT